MQSRSSENSPHTRLADVIKRQKWNEPWKEKLVSIIEQQQLSLNAIFDLSAEELLQLGFSYDERQSILRRLRELDRSVANNSKRAANAIESCDKRRKKQSNPDFDVNPLANLYLLSSQISLQQQFQQQQALVAQQASMSQLCGTISALQSEVYKRSSNIQQQRLYHRWSQQASQQQQLQQYCMLQCLPPHQKKSVLRELVKRRAQIQNRHQAQNQLVGSSEPREFLASSNGYPFPGPLNSLPASQSGNHSGSRNLTDNMELSAVDPSNEFQSPPTVASPPPSANFPSMPKRSEVASHPALVFSPGSSSCNSSSSTSVYSASSSSSSSSSSASCSSQCSSSKISSSRCVGDGHSTSTSFGQPDEASYPMPPLSMPSGARWWNPSAPPFYECIDRRQILNTSRVFPHERLLLIEGSLYICVTLQGESWSVVDKTLSALARNIGKLVVEYDLDIIDRIVMVLVCDGYLKLHPSVIKQLQIHGLIQLKQMAQCSDIVAFRSFSAEEETHAVQKNKKERSTRLHCHYSKCSHFNDGKEYGPFHLLIVIKENSSGVLDSHKIFLDGFCHRVKPDYVLLLPISITPSDTGLFHLYDTMERDCHIGGCAGEVQISIDWWNPCILFQYFQSKVAHVFGKSMESITGFVSVLPSGFSIYRYAALTQANAVTGESPLTRYFVRLSEAQRKSLSPLYSNIYLAEDKILSFEIISRKGISYSLRYNPYASATMAVAKSIAEILRQRKRWVNGVLLGLLYQLIHIKNFLTSGLKWYQKFTITVHLLLNVAVVMAASLGPGLLFLIFEFSAQQIIVSESELVGLSGGSVVGSNVCTVISFLYLFVLLLLVVFGIGNTHPATVNIFYIVSMVYLCIFQLIVIAFIVFWVYLRWDSLLAFSVISLGISLPLAVLFHSAHFMDGFLQSSRVCASSAFYAVMLPLSLLVVPIRSFANMHDSFRASFQDDMTMDEEILVQERVGSFERFRSIWMLAWVSVNAVIAATCVQLHKSFGTSFSDWFLKMSFVTVACFSIVRFLCLVASRWIMITRKQTRMARNSERFTFPQEDNMTTISREQLSYRSMLSARSQSYSIPPSSSREVLSSSSRTAQSSGNDSITTATASDSGNPKPSSSSQGTLDITSSRSYHG